MSKEPALEYEWSIDTSGTIEKVIAEVEELQPKPYKKLVGEVVAKKTNAAGDVVKSKLQYKEVEVTPTAENKADFERARASILAELADIKTPFAGVCARYQPNREPLGGYRLSIDVAAYERME